MIFGRDLQFMMPSLLSQLKVISQQTKSLCHSHSSYLSSNELYDLTMKEKDKKKNNSEHFLPSRTVLIHCVGEWPLVCPR